MEAYLEIHNHFVYNVYMDDISDMTHQLLQLYL